MDSMAYPRHNHSMSSLEHGEIVLFDLHGSTLLATIKGFSKGKVLLATLQDGEHEIPSDRLFVLGHEPSLSLDQKLQEVVEHAAAELSSENLWNQLRYENARYTPSDLAAKCELSPTPINLAAIIIRLSKERLYFQRDKLTFFPVDEQELTKRKELLLQQRERESKHIALIAAIKNQTQLPESSTTILRLLEDIVGDNEQVNDERLKEFKEFSARYEQELDVRLDGERKLASHAILTKAGTFTPRTNPILFRYRPPVTFPADLTLDEPEWLNLKRVSFDGWHTVTIDDSSTKDIDDAISWKTDGDTTSIAIHIADVGSIIKPGSALDKEASRRGTSVYLPEQTIPMLPRHLSEEHFSLIAGKERKVFSVVVKLNELMSVSSSEVVAGVITVDERLTYDETNSRLSAGDAGLLRVQAMTDRHREQRVENGAKDFNRPDVSVKVAEDGTVSVTPEAGNTPAHFLVSECMVLSNREFARFAKRSAIPIVFRTQDDEEDAPEGAVRAPMPRSQLSLSAGPHRGLALECYTQMTSPIRRYTDLLGQRALACFFAGKPTTPLHEKLLNSIERLENALGRGTVVSRESKRYWLLRYLQQQLALGNNVWEAQITRTDLRHPIIEIIQCRMTSPLPFSRRVKVGEVIKVRISVADPIRDALRMEEIK